MLEYLGKELIVPFSIAEYMRYLLFYLGFLLSTILAVAQPPEKPKNSYRIGILGCHRQFEPAPSLLKYGEMNPDLCLWIGDNIYGDTESDIGYLDSCYQVLAAKPAFRQLREQVPMYATWDDHDFGLNDAGRFYPLKRESKDLFRKFWGLEEEIPETQTGIFYQKSIEIGGKTLQLIMLDVRYNRDDPGRNSDVLGEEQWEWLDKVLQEPADLRLMVSGFQLLLDESSGSETWAKFPSARERLFELIRKNATQHLVFLAGDQHYGEVSRMSKVLDFDAIELQFASINQIETPEFNSYRVSPVCTSLHSYALMDIQWDITQYDIPHLLFQVYDATTDQLEVSYRVNFAELETPIYLEGSTEFVDSSMVKITHSFSPLEARYTLDGGEPQKSSPVYTHPIPFTQSGTLRVALFDTKGFRRSAVYSEVYKKVTPKKGREVKKLKQGLHFSYVEGEFSRIPDFSQVEAIKKGITQDLDVKRLADREDHYALLFHGYIQIDTTGVYTFSLVSDDGSKLFLHDQLVVDNDGSHSARKREGSIALEKGYHPISLMYFEDYMGQKLELFYKRASEGLQPFSFEKLFYSEN